MTAQAQQPVPPIATRAEAEQLVVHITDVMDRLQQVIREETDLLRAGHLGTAARLEKAKTDLARVYAAGIARFKANDNFLMRTLPDNMAALQQRHDGFRSLVQLNLTVVATAHAVSEGIIRGIAGELARKAAPRTYGASGRPVAVPKTSYQPLAVSRTL